MRRVEGRTTRRNDMGRWNAGAMGDGWPKVQIRIVARSKLDCLSPYFPIPITMYTVMNVKYTMSP